MRPRDRRSPALRAARPSGAASQRAPPPRPSPQPVCGLAGHVGDDEVEGRGSPAFARNDSIAGRTSSRPPSTTQWSDTSVVGRLVQDRDDVAGSHRACGTASAATGSSRQPSGSSTTVQPGRGDPFAEGVGSREVLRVARRVARRSASGAGHPRARRARLATPALGRGGLGGATQPRGHLLQGLQRDRWMLLHQAAEHPFGEAQQLDVGLSAVTVAVRGPPSRSAISPKKSPGPSEAFFLPPIVTSAASRPVITNRPTPGSPSRAITVPADVRDLAHDARERLQVALRAVSEQWHLGEPRHGFLSTVTV